MKKKDNLFTILAFIFLTIIVFRNYFFKGKVPFPGNLLVSLYQPWVSQKFPGWENGVPNKPIGVDNLRIFYPQRNFTNQMIKKGQIPFWNPYNFSGNVHLANSQTAVFYPLFLPFYFLKPILAWSLILVIQPILTGFFTYLFLKLITKDYLSSLYGAFVFAFCGFMIVRWQHALVIVHTALWLPFILFCLEKSLIDQRKKWFFLTIFGLLCSVLAGWFQVTFYVWLISFLYWAFRILSLNKEKYSGMSFSRKRESIMMNYLYRFRISASWRTGMTLVSPFLIALFLGAFHLFPAIEALFLSPRGLKQPEDFSDRFLMPWYHLITFLAPDFFGNIGAYNFFGKGFYHEIILYIGLVPLTLALWALIRLWKKKKEVLFFGILGLITLPLGFDLSITRWFLKLPLPIISSFLPSRIFFINSFCFSVLSAFGFSLFQKKKKKGLKIILGIFFLSLLIAGGYAVLNWAQNSYQYRGYFYRLLDWAIYHQIKLYSLLEAKVMIRNLIIPFGTFFAFLILVFASKFFSKRWSILLCFLLTIAPQLYLANKYLYFSEKQFTFPSHPVFQFLKEKAGINRFWSWGKSHIVPNFASYYQVYSPEGVDAMYPLWYAELVEAVDKKGQIRNEVPRIEPLITQVGDAEVDWENPLRFKFLSLLGVKYVVGLKNERFLPPESSFQKVWENEQWAAWEYKEALPRAFLVYDYQVATDKQKIADYIFAEDFDLSKTIVLEEKPSITIQPFNNSTINEKQLDIIKYTPNKIEILVNSPRNSLLFLSDVYYPGWKVFIDQKQDEILKANYAFRAVPVPAGKHQIVFSYFPDSFKKGLAISLLTLGGLILWLRIDKIKKKNAK